MEDGHEIAHGFASFSSILDAIKKPPGEVSDASYLQRLLRESREAVDARAPNLRGDARFPDWVGIVAALALERSLKTAGLSADRARVLREPLAQYRILAVLAVHGKVNLDRPDGEFDRINDLSRQFETAYSKQRLRILANNTVALSAAVHKFLVRLAETPEDVRRRTVGVLGTLNPPVSAGDMDQIIQRVGIETLRTLDADEIVEIGSRFEDWRRFVEGTELTSILKDWLVRALRKNWFRDYGPIDADDAAQHALRQAITDYSLRSDLKPWLLGAARNFMRNAWRAGMKYVPLEVPDDLE